MVRKVVTKATLKAIPENEEADLPRSSGVNEIMHLIETIEVEGSVL